MYRDDNGQVESIQKLWRRYRMRRQLEHWGGVRKQRLHELDRQWGALTIQRCVYS